MQSEFATTSSISSTLGLSMDVTGGYGPVQAGVNVDSDTQTTLENSRQQASAFVRERVEQVRTSVEHSIRTQRTTRTLDKTLNRSTHAIENTSEGAAAFAGVYRWVDRIHACRLLNHGTRVLLEFYVPEPAALLVNLEASPTDAVVIEEPPALVVRETTGERPLRPDDIEEVELRRPRPPVWCIRHRVPSTRVSDDLVHGRATGLGAG